MEEGSRLDPEAFGYDATFGRRQKFRKGEDDLQKWCMGQVDDK